MNLDNAREIDALFWMLAGPKGFLALHRPGSGRHWIAVDQPKRWRFYTEAWSYGGDLSVGLVPWLDKTGHFTVDGNVLWARVESGASAAKLARLKPVPTLVVREGSSGRRTALWALSKPLSFEWVERANRRLAHHLRTPKKWCGSTGEIWIPGTILRTGRKRPVAVHVESFEPTALYEPRQVVGHLRDAPNPDAWRENAA